jgi:hypothetical protein
MAARFEVTDPLLKQMLLLHFVQQIEQPEQMDRQILAGVSMDLIDHLRANATISEMLRLAAVNRPVFEISFDDVALMGSFGQLDRIQADAEMREYLGRHGATIDQLADWFRMSRGEARALRDHLSPKSAAGRPKLPPIDQREDIHRAWASTPAGTPEREAYYLLHQQFPTTTIAVLHQVVHEHDVKAPLPSQGGFARTTVSL